MPASLRRLAPLTGIPFAILLVVTFTTPSTPDVPDTGVQVINHYNDHHGAHLLGDIAGGIAVVFFLFFISSLRSYFKGREGGADGLSMAAFAGGILIAVGGGLFTSLDVALIDARNDITPQAAQALNVLSNDIFFPFEIGLIVFALSIGLAIIASGALPRWLGWVMVVIGVVAFTPVGFFGFFVVLPWAVIVAVLMYRRTAPGDRTPATVAA
ncbi:MAG TPA: hypothetical protein VFN72_04100 [Solirubrobacterales bacterium]|nr:hypothetical protein [Solirubrobacterales bacterium]